MHPTSLSKRGYPESISWLYGPTSTHSTHASTHPHLIFLCVCTSGKGKKYFVQKQKLPNMVWIPTLSIISLSVTHSLFLLTISFQLLKNASSVLYPSSSITYLSSPINISDALRSHYQITCNPCLQGALHLARSQLSQQFQGDVLKCGHTQALLKIIEEGSRDVSSPVKAMSSSFPSLSSKTVASTCDPNSSFLLISSVDHFLLETPVTVCSSAFTFFSLPIFFCRLPLFHPIFILFFLHMSSFSGTWCFYFLNLHSLCHSTLLLI